MASPASGGAGGPGAHAFRAPTLSALGDAAKLSSVLVAALYALVYLSYDRFFSPLGLTPADVGNDFDRILASLGGLVGSGLVIAVPAALVVRRLSRVPLWLALPCAVFTTVLLPLLYALTVAGGAAREVRAGHPVLSQQRQGFGGTLLDIKAVPATLRPATAQAATGGVKDLVGQDLLYLGRADGRAVFYDAKLDSAVLVPLDLVVIRLANCRVEDAVDPRCGRLKSRRS